MSDNVVKLPLPPKLNLNGKGPQALCTLLAWLTDFCDSEAFSALPRDEVLHVQTLLVEALRAAHELKDNHAD